QLPAAFAQQVPRQTAFKVQQVVNALSEVLVAEILELTSVALEDEARGILRRIMAVADQPFDFTDELGIAEELQVGCEDAAVLLAQVFAGELLIVLNLGAGGPEGAAETFELGVDGID